MSRHGKNVQAKARKNAKRNRSLARNLRGPGGMPYLKRDLRNPNLLLAALARRKKNAELEEPYRKHPHGS